MEAAPRGLDDIKLFVISSQVIEESIAFLRTVGKQGLEGFVIWGGSFVATDRFEFRTVYIPRQNALRTKSGLLVVVEGDALFEVNKRAYEGNEILGAQVHTHPTRAYHSDTDDHYPLVTLRGALSVVIPDFARQAPIDMKWWAWYRLQDYGSWIPLGDDQLVTIK